MLFHPLSIGDPTRYLCLTTQRACTILCILLTITQIVVYAFLPRVLRYVLIAIAALMFGVVLTSIIKLQQTLLVLSLVFTALFMVIYHPVKGSNDAAVRNVRLERFELLTRTSALIVQ
ncbi:hypothetical protein Y032_0145g2490 [Ancylostoma ceylanicum]|uniref:Uncharacterized protein n=1 Tax=Ancylostoma ceylanicum TaxID=53326 RepID=A0A016T2W6_9BILA|nr:hypothetical protein Y032_0145g2490 [Ancylostoma ceylanicum]